MKLTILTFGAAVIANLPVPAFAADLAAGMPRPLALVVVGGILLAPILILIILPVMIDVFTRIRADEPIGEATPAPGE